MATDKADDGKAAKPGDPANKPEVTKPEVVKPEAGKPLVASTEPVKTGAAKPDASKPETASKPDTSKPDTSKPDPLKAAEPAKSTGPTAVASSSAATSASGVGGPSSAKSSVDRSEWTHSDSRGPLEKAEDKGAPFRNDAGDEKLDVAGDPAPIRASTDEKPSAGSTPSATSATPVASEPEPEKRSLVPVAAGLVIGAIIGAGSAAIVYANHGGGTTGSSEVTALASRVDALEKRPGDTGAVSKLQGDISDLSNRVASLQKSGGGGGAAAPGVDLGPLQERVAALQTSVDALKSQGGDTKALQSRIAALEGDVAGAKRESSAAQAGMAGVEDRQKLLANKVMVPALAVVADSLVQQIDQGQPYGAQVDALTALGADPVKIAVLRQNAEKGVPSAKILAAKFEPLSGPIVATANKAPANAGFVDRLKSGMFSMVSVRNADDTSGTDLPSRVAHIKVALAHDDIADALATWNALPPEAKAKGEAWAALAKTSGDAMAAARSLQHDAIVALAAKKS